MDQKSRVTGLKWTSPDSAVHNTAFTWLIVFVWLQFSSHVTQQAAIKIHPSDSNLRDASFSSSEYISLQFQEGDTGESI